MPTSSPGEAQLTYMYSVHWFSTFTQIFKHSFSELRSFVSCKSDQTDTKKHPKICYYTLLNVSLKFLTRHNGNGVKKIKFDRWSYRLILLVVLFLFPFYIYFYTYYTDLSACYHYWFAAPICTYELFWQIFTFGQLTLMVLHYFFASSVIISLVGLAYGGEIAYRLR